MKFVLIGSVVLLAMIWALLTFKPIPGAGTGLISNLAAALLRHGVRISVRHGVVAESAD